MVGGLQFSFSVARECINQAMHCKIWSHADVSLMHLGICIAGRITMDALFGPSEAVSALDTGLGRPPQEMVSDYGKSMFARDGVPFPIVCVCVWVAWAGLSLKVLGAIRGRSSAPSDSYMPLI